MKTENELTRIIGSRFVEQVCANTIDVPSSLSYKEYLQTHIRLASGWGTATVTVSDAFAVWLSEPSAEKLLNNVEHAQENVEYTALDLLKGAAVLVNLGRNRAFKIILKHEQH